TTEVMLAGAIVRAVEGNTLVLGHESAPLAKRLSEQRNADVIRDALKDALGVDWRVRCEPGVGAPAAEADPTPAEPAPDVVDPQRAEEDSMIAEVDRDAEDPAPRRDPEEVALELLQ
ncbi:MAG: DNA polymerase III subunit gamma/tau, partial [Mycobacterium sp.]|nr:DNA polymerase III subunit gamma/tau [Mycobacterium sp.]